MSGDTTHYDDAFAAFLEEVWGEGYLSPGGPAEVARVLDGVDLTGKTVLDIGCGTGAITLSLAQDHGAAQAIGIDVEAHVCSEARARIDAAGAADKVSILQVTPGPFPFDDATFDVVFSKDSIIHIGDKEALASEIFRVLRSGGCFAASDWLISHDDTPSDEMAHYIEMEGMDFEMASPQRYANALTSAGFEGVRTLNRADWYHSVASDELAMLTGPRKAELESRFGKDLLSEQTTVWEVMVAVLKTGELCPHHLRGTKP